MDSPRDLKWQIRTVTCLCFRQNHIRDHRLIHRWNIRPFTRRRWQCQKRADLPCFLLLFPSLPAVRSTTTCKTQIKHKQRSVLLHCRSGFFFFRWPVAGPWSCWSVGAGWRRRRGGLLSCDLVEPALMEIGLSVDPEGIGGSVERDPAVGCCCHRWGEELDTAAVVVLVGGRRWWSSFAAVGRGSRCWSWRLFGGWGRKDLLAEAGAVGLRRWGTALPVLWSGKMRLLCGRELLRLLLKIRGKGGGLPRFGFEREGVVPYCRLLRKEIPAGGRLRCEWSLILQEKMAMARGCWVCWLWEKEVRWRGEQCRQWKEGRLWLAERARRRKEVLGAGRKRELRWLGLWGRGSLWLARRRRSGTGWRGKPKNVGGRLLLKKRWV